MTYLTYRLGRLFRTQVEALAEQIYHDLSCEGIRPLGEICRQISLPIPTRDVVLDRTVLKYSPQEMNVQEGNLYPYIRTADVQIGCGYLRPLLHDIYSACDFDNLSIIDEKRKNDEHYVPNTLGVWISEAIHDEFSISNWPKNTVIVVNHSSHCDKFV